MPSNNAPVKYPDDCNGITCTACAPIGCPYTRLTRFDSQANAVRTSDSHMPAGAELIECPYMPAGFVAFKESDGATVVLNTANGYSFRLPPIEYVPAMPACFVSKPSIEDRAISSAIIWRYRKV